MEALTSRRETLSGGVAVVLIAAYYLQDQGRSKSMTSSAREEGLSPDLIPFISQPDVSMAVVNVLGVRWTRQIDRDLEVESGPVTFEVRRQLRGTLPEGQIIEVPAKRIADPSIRARHNFDAWNTLSLVPAELIILAARAGASPTKWNAVAAQRVSAPEGGDVQAVRQAYAIEKIDGDLKAKAQMLESALKSGQHILLFYALDYLRRHAGERQVAANVLAGALSSSVSSDQKLEIGRALTAAEYFKSMTKPDPVDTMIVDSLASALVQETDDARRVSWAQLLGTCVLMDFTGHEGENRKVQSALIHSAVKKVGVREAIASAELIATPDLKPTLERLKRAWQTP